MYKMYDIEHVTIRIGLPSVKRVAFQSVRINLPHRPVCVSIYSYEDSLLLSKCVKTENFNTET